MKERPGEEQDRGEDRRSRNGVPWVNLLLLHTSLSPACDTCCQPVMSAWMCEGLAASMEGHGNRYGKNQ